MISRVWNTNMKMSMRVISVRLHDLTDLEHLYKVVYTRY